MSRTIQTSPSLPLWRSALLGPMPLSYPLIAACAFYYLLGIGFSLVTGGFDLHALSGYIWAPSDDVQVALGNGGLAPLAAWQIWTLITSSFLHLNLLHIGVNMLCLYQIMPAVERGFGRMRAFSIYTLAGISGSLGSAIYGELYSLGASGAIFGLLGAVLVYGARRRDAYGRQLMLYSLQWAGINLAFGIFGPIHVSNAGHVGGFIGGILAAFALTYRTDPQGAPDTRRLAEFLAGLTLLCLVIGIGHATSAAWQARTDPPGYEARRNDDLLATYSAILAIKPGDASVRLQRASAYAQRGEYASAVSDSDAALAAGVDTPILHRFKAWNLVMLGRNTEALPEIETALKGNPSDPVALNIRGHLNEARGDRDKAISDYQAALRLDPKDENSQQALQRLTAGQ